MKTEFITLREKETAAKIQNTVIDAVRVKDIIKKGVRVFKDGKIGISGAIGNVPDQELIDRAIANLGTGIAYEFPLESNRQETRDLGRGAIPPETLMSYADDILETLRTDYPDFDFSEKIGTKQVEVTMRNTEGLDLCYRDAYFELGLMLKEKSSANLFDGFIQYYGRDFDPQAFWQFNRGYLEAYRNSVQLPEGDKLPVFMMDSPELLGFLNKTFNGERFATGSSLLSGRIGNKIFDEKVVIGQSTDSRLKFDAFFDREGVSQPDDFYPLVENGVMKAVYTDKRTAATYGLPHTGAASGTYDGMPKLAQAKLAFKTDTDDIVEALKGQKAIFVVVSAGGDFTPDGNYAAPVQVSFLFDGEKIIGKLPEFSVRSNLFNMLGDDYIGTFDNPFYIGENSQIQGFYMTIAR